MNKDLIKRNWIVVERVKSPPDLNQLDLVYEGEFIEFKKIPLELNLDPDDARNYYWSITYLDFLGDRLKISRGVYTYDEILSGERSYGNSSYKEINLPLTDTIRCLVGLADLRIKHVNQ